MEDTRAEIIVKDVAELFKVLTRQKGETLTSLSKKLLGAAY